jgi:hypothetical protein
MTPFNPKSTITNQMTAAITQIERVRGFLEAVRLSDDWLPRYGQPGIDQGSAPYHPHIEGTGLTLDQATRLWRGEAVPGAAHDDTRELLNYHGQQRSHSRRYDS